MREWRRSTDRRIAGVAAGCAEYFGMDKTLWRIAWVLGSLVVWPLPLLYLLLAAILPSAPAGADPAQYAPPEVVAATPPRPTRRLVKSRDRWIAGVAAGVAEYLELDAGLVRLLFVASLFVGGTGLFVYLLLWVIMPDPDYSYQTYQVR